jgi:hypothetical protein
MDLPAGEQEPDHGLPGCQCIQAPRGGVSATGVEFAGLGAAAAQPRAALGQRRVPRGRVARADFAFVDGATAALPRPLATHRWPTSINGGFPG